MKALFLDELATALGFCLALFSEINIDPTRELVGGIPLALAMTKKNKFSVTHALYRATNGNTLPSVPGLCPAHGAATPRLLVGWSEGLESFQISG